jgi:hydrogenase maturation protein HypF
LDPFVLLGGERAIREPKRVAYILLREVGQEDLKGIFPYLDEIEIRFFQRIIQTGFNCPLTSSVGRLFDGVASILGLRHINTFEAQAAMELEFAADAEVHGFYPFHLKRDKILLIDWRPLISTLVQQMLDGVSLPSISGKFHNTLVEVIVSIAKEVGTQKVVLSGGCFQNRILTERACKRLGQEGFRVYIHQRVPTNDGGISLGQAIVGGTKGT